MMAPKIMVLFTSYRCNARCVMCYAWHKQDKHSELSVDDIKRIFSDTLLRNSIEIVNLTGGEPTLRTEFVDIIHTLAETCVHLKRIDISTNGINTENTVDKIEQALAILLPYKVNLSACVSVDGVGKIHDDVRGVEGAFVKIDRTIDELKDLLRLYPTFGLGLNFTVSKRNYPYVREAFEYSAQKTLGMSFTLSALSEIGVESIQVREGFELSSQSKESVFECVKFLAQEGKINSEYAAFLSQWLKKGKRKGQCAFRKGESILCEPNGSMYMCGNFKQFFIGNALERSFTDLMRERKNFTREYIKRCPQCNSNCYITHG